MKQSTMYWILGGVAAVTAIGVAITLSQPRRPALAPVTAVEPPVSRVPMTPEQEVALSTVPWKVTRAPQPIPRVTASFIKT